MKVIVAGYPKTGTKSVNAALTQLGYSVYDALENLVFLQDEYIAILNKGWSTEDFRRMYENVDAIADMPAFFFWDEIHKAFPDAKVMWGFWYYRHKIHSSRFCCVIVLILLFHRYIRRPAIEKLQGSDRSSRRLDRRIFPVCLAGLSKSYAQVVILS